MWKECWYALALRTFVFIFCVCVIKYWIKMLVLLFVIQCLIHISGDNQQPFTSCFAISYCMHVAVKFLSHTGPLLSSQSIPFCLVLIVLFWTEVKKLKISDDLNLESWSSMKKLCLPKIGIERSWRKLISRWETPASYSPVYEFLARLTSPRNHQ